MHDNLQPAVFTAPATNDAPPTPATLAPWWHTLAILLLFACSTLASSSRTTEILSTDHLNRYLGVIIVGWMSLGTVVAGLYHRRAFFKTTLQRNARTWYVEVATGFGIFCVVFLAMGIVVAIFHHTRFGHQFDNPAIRALGPRTFSEFAMWTVISLTAGFCEEHEFRGYLLQQVITFFERIRIPLTSARVLAAVLTSSLFSMLHLYEGVGGAVLIGVLGLVYCLFALRRQNLRAVIVAHFMQDFFAGLFLFLHHLRTHA